jgi:hypothetical protein
LACRPWYSVAGRFSGAAIYRPAEEKTNDDRPGKAVSGIDPKQCELRNRRRQIRTGWNADAASIGKNRRSSVGNAQSSAAKW